MEVTIIDNTPVRLSKLKTFLEAKKISVVQSFEVNDDLASNNSKLFLIHKSNDKIVSFVQKVQAEKFILFFSGGGISQNVDGINYTDRMFNLPDVFNIGNEEQPLNRIKQIIEIVKNEPNETNATTEIKKVLGFDEKEEALTEAIFNAIYEQKDEDTIEKAVSIRDKYLKGKSKN